MLKIFDSLSLTHLLTLIMILCTSVCRSVLSRCRECIETEGLQFEHLS